MQIKDLEELENQLNEVGCGLDNIKSLSRILLDCIHGGDNLKPQDVANLTYVLDEKITSLKEKFNLIAKELNI